MGTFSAALYADDTACDVRDQFLELLAKIKQPAEATDELLKSWQGSLSDDDERAIVWMALADTQWKYGCLSEQVRLTAIEMIDSGIDLSRWEGRLALRRQAMQSALKEKLLKEQPKLRIPRIKKLVALPSVKSVSPDAQAWATAFALGESSYPDAPRMQVMVEMISRSQKGGGGVFTASCEYSAVELEWIDASTLRIRYPADAVVGQMGGSFYYYGRTIQVVYDALP
ncbi:hypothetical protein EIP75_05565 [Aquabacterium soli]|uniref:Uncharacterized protein n=1 Tax=Aquabacterium soli TaxID=2493092 RepID=A0A3R8T697_9BURK|nr:hypothetical protein [Aquabacterium soli]RRS05046.1 hypothetical protein EIP75_05565 [Aquabacterium soli]